MQDIARGPITSLRTVPVQPSTRSALQWRKIARRLSLAVAGAVLVLGLGLLGLRLAGYQYISVRGDSMQPAFSSGSLLVARPAAAEDIRAGDVISFAGPSAGGPDVVHRVAALFQDRERIVAITMGDNNPLPDPRAVPLDGTVPRVVLTLPYLGWALTPGLGWVALAISALLSLRVALRWKAQWKRRTCTKVLRHIGTKGDAVVYEQL